MCKYQNIVACNQTSDGVSLTRPLDVWSHRRLCWVNQASWWCMIRGKTREYGHNFIFFIFCDCSTSFSYFAYGEFRLYSFIWKPSLSKLYWCNKQLKDEIICKLASHYNSWCHHLAWANNWGLNPPSPLHIAYCFILAKLRSAYGVWPFLLC